MSSSRWKRCPNCQSSTNQAPITASDTSTYRLPLFEKPVFTPWIKRRCTHCGTEYIAWFKLNFSHTYILSKEVAK